MLKKILKKISYKIIKYSGVQGNITHNFDEKLRRVTPKAFLDSIGFNLVEHCNLHCYSCDHFSQLAKKEYLDINVFEKDVKRLKEILLQGNAMYMGGGEVSNLDSKMLESKAQNLKITESILQTTHIPKHLSPTISLLGGEPLLNNNITQYFRILQKYFPNSTIWLITNALLLPKMPHEFWQACKECNITLRPTKYPVKINWDDIFAKCEKYGVVLDFFNDAQVEKVSFKTAMNFKGEGDIFDNFINCHRANSCTELHNGRIYPCAIAAHIKHFNEYFDKKLVQSNLDSLDIHKSDITQNEILNFMARPIPFCRYCEIKKMTYKPWSSSNKSIDEYEV